MASDITISSSVRNNLLSLQNTADLMARTQERLATGKKVTSALDNPTNFFTASALSSRSNDLANLLDSMSNGIKTLEAADNGLKAITKTVEQMQATVRQARQDKSFQGTSYTIDTAAIGTATAKTMSFSGGAVGTTPTTINVNTADVAATETTLAGTGADFSTDFAGGTISVNGTDVAIRGDADAVATTLDGAAGTFGTYTGGDIEIDGETITIADDDDAAAVAAAIGTALGAGYTVAEDSGQVTISKADGTDIAITGDDTLLTTIGFGTANRAATNGTEAFDATATTVLADLNGAGITGFTAADASGQVSLELASGADLTLAGDDATLTAIGFATAGRASTNGSLATTGAVKTVDALVSEINTALDGKVRATNDNGKLRIENLSTEDLTVAGVGTDGEIDGTVGTTSIGGNDARVSLIAQFNDLRDQLNKLSDDASLNGINLLRGDKLTISFNETGTSTAEIQAKDGDGINTTELAIDIGTGDEFGDDAALDGRLAALADSLTTLRSQSSSFGSNLSIVQNRQDFTKAMMTTLQSAADNLTLADTNEEGANMLALQTRQQLSSVALSLASQADQSVLRLF